MDWLKCFKNYERQYRTHALERMIKRNIDFTDIDEITNTLTVIEEYPDDIPYPSCLVLGFTLSKRPIHIVFSVNKTEKIVFIITIYEPDIQKWDNNFKRRKS